MRLLPKNWNDVLSLILIVGIFILWTRFELPEDVKGATIMVLASIVSFYFRKAPPEPGNNQPPPGETPIPHG